MKKCIIVAILTFALDILCLSVTNEVIGNILAIICLLATILLFYLLSKKGTFMKTFKLNQYGAETECILNVSVYLDNSNLYLGLESVTGEPYASITTNIEKLPEGQAAINTNNCPWAENFILENKLGVNTGKKLKSGYCTYPVYEFDLNHLSKISESYM